MNSAYEPGWPSLVEWTRLHLAKNIGRQTQDYLETILWSEHDESTPNGGEPLDRNYSVGDFTDKSVELATKDLEAFYKSIIQTLSVMGDEAEEGGEESAKEFENDLNDVDWSNVGYHFWLSRVGHGTGFFDHEDKYGEFAEMLQDLAAAQGERHIFVDDDGISVE